MRIARTAAVLTWVYAACFGIPTIPVGMYLRERGELPVFQNLFPMYGGRWSTRVFDDTFIELLLTFLIVTMVAATSAWLLWTGSRAGAGLNLGLLPIEAAFWLGFGLPIPWLFGLARAALIPLALRSP